MLWGYEEKKWWKNTAGKEVSEGVTYLNGVVFKSISGGGGNGPFPAGRYRLMPAYQLGPNHPNIDAYRREGLAFFAPLIPLFNTIRNNLGVHPDGNLPGTMGCDGLVERINEAFKILLAIPKDGIEFDVVLLPRKSDDEAADNIEE